MKEKKRCVICDFKFDTKFPRKFPKEWMLCCSCLSYAQSIASNENSIESFVGVYNIIYGDSEEGRKWVSDFKQRLEKLNKLISLE